MAQPVVIRRLEEAVDSCAQFEDEAKEAHEPLDELLRSVTDLTETLRSEGEATGRVIDQARAALSELRATLEDAGEEARSEVQAVAERAVALQQESEAALETVRANLEELGARREELSSALENGQEKTGEECRDLGAQIETLQSEAAQGLEQTMQGIGEFQTVVDQARTGFHQARGQWGESIAAMGQASGERTGALVEEISTLAQTAGRALIDGANEVIEEHNATMDKLWESLASEAAEQVAAAAEVVSEALDEIEGVRSDRSGAIESTAPQLVEMIRGVAGQLEEIETEIKASIDRVPQV